MDVSSPPLAEVNSNNLRRKASRERLPSSGEPVTNGEENDAPMPASSSSPLLGGKVAKILLPKLDEAFLASHGASAINGHVGLKTESEVEPVKSEAGTSAGGASGSRRKRNTKPSTKSSKSNSDDDVVSIEDDENSLPGPSGTKKRKLPPKKEPENADVLDANSEPARRLCVHDEPVGEECCRLDREDEDMANDHESIILVDLMSKFGNLVGDDGGLVKLHLDDYLVYDYGNPFRKREKRLLPFDAALDAGLNLYISGKVSKYSNTDGSCDSSSAIHGIGPIKYWWLSREEGADTMTIGFTTEGVHYYLGVPHPLYAVYMDALEKKSSLAYEVIDILSDEPDISQDDFMQRLEDEHPDADDLLDKYASFVVDQIDKVSAEDDEDEAIKSGEVYENLLKLSKKKGKGKAKKPKARAPPKPKGPSLNSQATTTPLVRSAFENLFPQQMGLDSKSGNVDEDNVTASLPWPPKVEPATASVSWTSSLIKKIEHKKYYSSCCVAPRSGTKDSAEMEISVGDFVRLKVRKGGNNSSLTHYIVKVHDLFEFDGKRRFHGIRFMHAVETIIGQALNPMELFASRDCADFHLSDVVDKIKVEREVVRKDWSQCGGKPVDGKVTAHHVYKFLVESTEVRFESAPEFACDPVGRTKVAECPNCKFSESRTEKVTLETDENDDVVAVTWLGVTYRVGDGVFLDPGEMQDPWAEKRQKPPTKAELLKGKDLKVFSELYRKPDPIKPKGYIDETTAPLRVGCVEGFKRKKGTLSDAATPDSVKVCVRIFDRVDEETDSEEAKLKPNALRWVAKTYERKVRKLVGKCKITREKYLVDDDGKPLSMAEWRLQHGFVLLDGPDDDEDDAEKLAETYEEMCRKYAKTFVPPVEPLKCMDLFCGVGGLSIGLQQSGVADPKWAIEFNSLAANSFKANHPDAKVYLGDINEILQRVLDSDKDPKNVKREWQGQALPHPGEVDIITGGPPCQGYSGMNRFNYRENARFRNSLVVPYLSCVEYFRPRYVIMENVKNFVHHNKGLVLKFMAKALIQIGYQTTTSVLQAGQFGVPQSRTRTVIIACAPGELLPFYPKPLHTFSTSSTTFKIDGLAYETGMKAWCPIRQGQSVASKSAPFRGITVGDAISDLPPVANGDTAEKTTYKRPPKTAFQAEMRGDATVVRDQICRVVNELVCFRIKKIPKYAGADWRDLPNISVTLKNGEVTEKLKYDFKDVEGRQLGVCPCAIKNSRCTKDQSRRHSQHKTVIPWCLPHNGNFHNQWAGLYGRICFDGYFATTLTAPEPMGKQGCVIHYDQDRILSVRECARSQGFPDDIIFNGRLDERYKQIGNAVPPPLARAIGFQIRRALARRREDLEENDA